MDWSRTRADYVVSFGADAANVEKARQLVVQARALQAKELPPPVPTTTAAQRPKGG